MIINTRINIRINAGILHMSIIAFLLTEQREV